MNILKRQYAKVIDVVNEVKGGGKKSELVKSKHKGEKEISNEQPLMFFAADHLIYKTSIFGILIFRYPENFLISIGGLGGCSLNDCQ